jgi:glycosyltransferase involved in cell wall biosynthesis
LGFANGLEYLVRVAHHARTLNDHIGFLLIGQGREKENLQHLARELGVLNQSVWFVDSLPRYEMPAVLSAATVATSIFQNNPVLWHNSANKFFDALAAGKPIAINYGGWQADLLNETGAGIVLPADDPAQAARDLLAFVSDPQRLQHAADAARELALTRFSRNMMADKLEQVLCQAVGK